MMANQHSYKANEFNQFLNTTQKCLESLKFKTVRDNALPCEANISLSASRTRFLWKGLVFSSQHVFITQMEDPSIADLKNIFEAGFEYVKKRNHFPLVRGLQFGYLIIPCIVSHSVNEDLKEFVSQQHKKHWARFDFPVVHDLDKNQTYYFRESFAWGLLFFSEARNIVSECIEFPIVPER